MFFGVTRLFSMLWNVETFEMSQHVTEATRCKGHTVDMVITKGLNVSDLCVTYPSLSDHFCIYIYILYIENLILKF